MFSSLFLVSTLVLTVFLAACATPQQRYKTLSFFFDGVPNPDAKKEVAQTQAAGPSIVTAVVLSRHKPYLEGKCGACHRSSTGTIMEFDAAYKACTQCHANVATEHTLMHGPVATKACQFCHTGHDSAYPHLFKDNPITICTQCHDSQLLGNNPPQHSDGRTNCLNCHFGHGGNAKYFLKQGAMPQWPTTAPATPPSTRPATTQPLKLQSNNGVQPEIPAPAGIAADRPLQGDAP